MVLLGIGWDRGLPLSLRLEAWALGINRHMYLGAPGVTEFIARGSGTHAQRAGISTNLHIYSKSKEHLMQVQRRGPCNLNTPRKSKVLGAQISGVSNRDIRGEISWERRSPGSLGLRGETPLGERSPGSDLLEA